MRRFFYSASAAILCIFIACNDTNKAAGNKDNSLAETNMQADNMISKAFQTGDLSGIDSVVADDFVDHTERGDKIGRDSLKAMITWVRSNFKDMKTEMISQAANDDRVFSLMRFTGTNTISVPGMSPGTYDMQSLHVTRFKGGKAVEHWSYMDMQEMMKMQDPAMDKTKTDSLVKK